MPEQTISRDLVGLLQHDSFNLNSLTMFSSGFLVDVSVTTRVPGMIFVFLYYLPLEPLRKKFKVAYGKTDIGKRSYTYLFFFPGTWPLRCSIAE